MILKIFNSNKTIIEKKGLLKVSQAYQVDDLAFFSNPENQVIVSEPVLFGFFPNKFPNKIYQAQWHTSDDGYPLNLSKTFNLSYRDKRPSKYEQGETLAILNKNNELEANRKAGTKQNTDINTKIFTYVCLGLLLNLVIMGIPIIIPAFEKSLGGF
tara:strand:- start:136 stop:603 length:468 start_codon:yes stop_codon:yes gene_type:complete